MKHSKKPRIFLALYHRGKLSLSPQRDKLGLACFHWALLISPKNEAQFTHIIDVTDAMQIDPLTGVNTNPEQNWILRHKVDNPLSNMRLVLVAMIGKLKTRADGLERLVETVKRECRLPRKGMGTEHCAWWVREAVRLLQARGLLDELDVDAIMLDARQQATDRIAAGLAMSHSTHKRALSTCLRFLPPLALEVVINACLFNRLNEVVALAGYSSESMLADRENIVNDSQTTYRTYYHITAAIDIPISIIVSMIHNNITASEGSQTAVRRTPETHTGTTTSWLSLITSPPPDSRCSHHLYSPDGGYHTLIAFDPRLETAANITCLPQEAVEWYTQRNLPFGATTGTVTSLGPMICPGGYTTASTSQKDASSTMVFCCPSHYDFATAADHGHLYGCTSMQTRRVTVHHQIPGETGSVTLAAGPPLRAPNIAGIAVNGWLLKPSPAVILPTATLTSDGWTKAHNDIAAAKLLGIIIGALAAFLLLIFTLGFFVRKRLCGRKTKSDAEAAPYVDDDTKNSSLSDDRLEPTQTRDVEMSNLNPSGSRASSAAETVVRHVEPRKSEGSSTDDERIA